MMRMDSRIQRLQDASKRASTRDGKKIQLAMPSMAPGFLLPAGMTEQFNNSI